MGEDIAAADLAAADIAAAAAAVAAAVETVEAPAVGAVIAVEAVEDATAAADIDFVCRDSQFYELLSLFFLHLLYVSRCLTFK